MLRIGESYLVIENILGDSKKTTGENPANSYQVVLTGLFGIGVAFDRVSLSFSCRDNHDRSRILLSRSENTAALY